MCFVFGALTSLKCAFFCQAVICQAVICQAVEVFSNSSCTRNYVDPVRPWVMSDSSLTIKVCIKWHIQQLWWTSASDHRTNTFGNAPTLLFGCAIHWHSTTLKMHQLVQHCFLAGSTTRLCSCVQWQWTLHFLDDQPFSPFDATVSRLLVLSFDWDRLTCDWRKRASSWIGQSQSTNSHFNCWCVGIDFTLSPFVLSRRCKSNLWYFQEHHNYDVASRCYVTIMHCALCSSKERNKWVHLDYIWNWTVIHLHCYIINNKNQVVPEGSAHTLHWTNYCQGPEIEVFRTVKGCFPTLVICHLWSERDLL